MVHISQPREICCSQFSPSAIWAWDWILATRLGWPQVPFHPQTITASVSLLAQTLHVWRNHFPVCFPKRFRFKEVFVAIGFECANYVVQWFFEKRHWSLGKSQNFEIHQHLMILPRTEWGGKMYSPSWWMLFVLATGTSSLGAFLLWAFLLWVTTVPILCCIKYTFWYLLHTY